MGKKDDKQRTLENTVKAIENSLAAVPSCNWETDQTPS